MNQTTRRFRDVTGTGAELQRLFAGLADGQRIEVNEGQYLPQHWQAVKGLAAWLNSQTGCLDGVNDGKTKVHD